MLKQQQNSPERTDTREWYKQFWPWVLIILPGTVVVASIATAIIAFKGADPLVVDNYYKEGIAINQTLSDFHTAKALNIKGLVTMQDKLLELVITANTLINDKELLLTFSHPLDNNQDVVLHLNNSGNNLYRADMPKLASGKWYITLQTVNTPIPWQINQTVFLPNPHIELAAP